MKITLQRTSPNYRQKLSTHRIMRDLSIGLLVIVAYSLFYQYTSQASSTSGMQYLTKAALIYGVSVGVAVVTEIVWALLHKSNILEQLKNSFPLVTSIIFALTLPIGTPLYVVGVGSFIAIFLGKLVYGGFGHNIFNPALVGRVVVHLGFGSLLTTSLPVNGIDIATKATPATMLASTKWIGGDGFTYSLMDLFFGKHAGALGESCIVLILIVGVLLALRKVFDARIPVAYLGTIAILAAAFAFANGLDVIQYAAIQLCLGGAVFGAIFMATDPVTSPSSPLGKILYGIFLGFLTMLIRLKANYPEGVLFSILIMNMLTPLIDSFILGRTNTRIIKQYSAIGLSIVLATGCIFGIGTSMKNDIIEAAAEAKKKEEEAAKKKAEEEANAVKFTLIEKTDANTYLMSAKGFNASIPMKIEVKIEGDSVKSVKVLEHAGETAGYGADLIATGKGAMLKPSAKTFFDTVLNGSFKTSDIDGIDLNTGATKTVTGIIEAIKGAIEESQKAPVVNGNIYTYTLSAKGFNANNLMKLKVSVDKVKQIVTKVEILEHSGETAGYGEDLIASGAGAVLKPSAKVFFDTILNGQPSFTEVDGIDTSTGATMTTKGIVEAIKDAIAQTK